MVSKPFRVESAVAAGQGLSCSGQHMLTRTASPEQTLYLHHESQTSLVRLDDNRQHKGLYSVCSRQIEEQPELSECTC